MKYVPQSFVMYPTDTQEIERIIRTLNNTKATGEDGIPVSLLQFCSDYIAAPLAHISNMCFQQGTFPDKLKYTIIKPIHKKGARDNFCNYRPIALISNISKIIEKMVLNRMINFVLKYNILHNNQNGYMKKRSTTRATYQLLEDILTGINNTDITVCALMDLTRAFDCVHHEVLLQKLERMGFRGVALDFLQSYLNGRRQSVVACEASGAQIASPWRSIMHGVPQGSILGPLLFLMYVNDLPKIVKGLAILYADDTSCIMRERTCDDINSTLELNFQNMKEWFETNNLKLNTVKTHTLLFNIRSDEVTVKYNDELLTCVEHARFLGITVDCDLSWKPHIEELAGKVSGFCYSLKVISQNVSVETALSVYRACVESRLRYGVIFWGNAVNSSRIFILQKSCVRAVFQLRSRDSCKQVFANNNILTLPSIYILEAVSFVKNHYYELFKKFELDHSHHTRGIANHHLVPPQTHLSKIKKQVISQCITLYNHVPYTLKQLPYVKFKDTIKKYLIKNSFYSVQEILACPYTICLKKMRQY